MEVADPAEQARVLRPGGGPRRLVRSRVEDLRLERRQLAQGEAQLVEQLPPAGIGRERSAQFQRRGPRSSTRRPRQYFTVPPPPPPPPCR